MSSIVVMKFGGTSVADAERIKRAARRIVEKRERGDRVVAVLSARGKTTDELIAMAEEVSDAPDPREMDMLLSTGERISCALCAMAIHDLGHRAISLTGSQAGIVTDESHTKARILDVRAERIRAALDEDRIVLVAGFQGVSTHASDVTTLGRGGSDTTAVAVAAALGRGGVRDLHRRRGRASRADPRIVPDARKLEHGVLRGDARDGRLRARACCSCARSSTRATTACASTAAPPSRTRPVPLCVAEGDRTMEQPLITAVTHSTAEARVTLVGVPDEPGAAARIFEALAQANVNVDMIVQNEPDLGGRAGGDLLHGPARGPARRARGARAARRRGVRRADRARGDGQGLDRRRRHALAPGRRGEGVRRARRARA